MLTALPAFSDARTPLHLAAAENALGVCRGLVARGLTVDSRDRCGITPIDEAKYRGYDALYSFLKSHSKDPERKWTQDELSCSICYSVFWKPVEAGPCGHHFCRSCLQLSRRPRNVCPLCRCSSSAVSSPSLPGSRAYCPRCPITLPKGYSTNVVLERIEEVAFPDEYQRTRREQESNCMELAICNLEEFGAALDLSLTFNERGSCVLRIDGEFEMHISFLSEKKVLYVYSPLLEGLPTDPLARVSVYERILMGALDRDEMAAGGIGVLLGKEMVVYHQELPLLGQPTSRLRRSSTGYVDTVKYWRRLLAEVCDQAKRLKEADTSPATKRRQISDCIAMPGRGDKRARITSPPSTPIDPRTASARTARARAAIDCFVRQMSAEPVSDDTSAEGGIRVRMPGLELAYEPDWDRVVLTASLLEGVRTLPETLRLRLYDKLLAGSAFGSFMHGCGAALARTERGEERLVLFAPVQMGDSDEASLVAFMPGFQHTLDTWRKALAEDVRQFQLQAEGGGTPTQRRRLRTTTSSPAVARSITVISP